jgi:hypothetical protein
VEATGGVHVLAHHLPAVVDAEGLGIERIGEVDPDKPTAVQQVPAARAVGVVQEPGLGVEADDLAAVIDLGGRGRPGAGDVDARDAAARVPQEAVLAAGVGVATDELAAVVAAANGGLGVAPGTSNLV